jgi:alpha-tubulin suppressor-like RCC1 family protein
MALSFEVIILNLIYFFPYIYNHFVWYAGRGGSDGSKTPKLIDKLQDVDVAKVYCGAQFSLALTKSGCVYSWGKGDTHRLGHASEEHVRFPKLIEVLQGKTSGSTGV